MKKNYAIEFLRFFFTLGVVVGHAYVVFFQNNNPTYPIIFHNACVDFFFVLSGFLMARHFGVDFNDCKYSDTGYVKYNFSRIKRFFPLLFIAALEGIVYEGVKGHFYYEKWPTFFFLGEINNFRGWNVIWYISALFWCGVLASALLCFFKKRAVLVHFPLIAFVSLSVMNIWGNCNLFSIPLVGEWFSSGLVRGMCALSFGIETFYLAHYVDRKISYFRAGAVAFASVVVELAFLFLVAYLMVKQNFNNAEFLMFFASAALLLILHLDQHRIFRIFDSKIWIIPGKISAMIYVTHFYIEKGLHHLIASFAWPDFAVYGLCVILACIAGFIASVLEESIIKRIRDKVLQTSVDLGGCKACCEDSKE